ncbi:MAG: hypothetical protein JO266_09530 [Acidobacteria bacterium]|nr:hypothetical protein [Acidobacteriota bacterium]
MPDEVAAMLRLKALGWGIKRIARELGCSHMPVRHYVAQGGWVGHRGGGRPRKLAGLEDWVAERFRRHAGNADIVRQELVAEKSIVLSLRTIERAVAPLRCELEAQARATLRFETPPGKQLQIDFGERRVAIGGSANVSKACPGGSTGTSRAPLRQTREGRAAARGALLWTTWTSHLSPAPRSQ